MELTAENTSLQQNYRLEFLGKGSEYFSIVIVNWLLTLVTLGLYYPWARAKKLRYIYGNVSLNNERFHFSGTGKEMFIGFIKLMVFYAIILGAFYYLYLQSSLLIAIIILYVGLLGIIPLAIHGAFRYRMSRTTYRGIRFGYRGEREKLVKYFFKWLILTAFTLGIYVFWMEMNLRRYIYGNIRYGDVEFDNESEGFEYFILNLKGYLLTILTLGIYSFWWYRDIFNYFVNTMSMRRGEQKIRCHSTATGIGFLRLLVGNFFIIVFTLGLGKAWADVRLYKFILDNIKLEGNINLDEIQQTEDEYLDAFGEDAMDFFDIDLA